MPYTVTLHADALRYVLPHVSPEASRPILNALNVSACGRITASNGVTIATHASGAEPGTPCLLTFSKPKALISPRVFRVTVHVSDTLGHACSVFLWDRKGRAIGSGLAEEIEGPFPDLSGIFRGIGDVIRAGNPIPGVSLDPARVALFDVPGAGPVRLSFDSDARPIAVTWARCPEALALLMPCRDITSGEDLATMATHAETLAGSLLPA